MLDHIFKQVKLGLFIQKTDRSEDDNQVTITYYCKVNKYLKLPVLGII